MVDMVHYYLADYSYLRGSANMFTNGHFVCDRCGKRIGFGKIICKECNKWLDEHYGKHSEENKESDNHCTNNTEVLDA